MVEQILEFNDHFQSQNNLIDVYDDDDNELSLHHKVPSVLDDLDWNDVTQLIHKMDSIPGMSSNARQMAQQHQQMILSWRNKLSKEKLIMRASYKSYSFHTYPAKEFEQKATTNMEKTGIYNLIDLVNPSNPKVNQKCLSNIIERVDTILTNLFHSKLITDQQYVVMHPKRSIVRLHYLYFVPDTYKEGEPLQPIIICNNGPISHTIDYLSGILWSMFNQVTHCKTFSNGGDDIVHALEQHIKDGHLHETTHFVTFNINEICTKFSHQIAIKALENFLNIHGSELKTSASIEGLTNETIIQLVRLVLQNQFFIYENKLYQQIYGGASGSLLTIPLACIYLFYGQSSLLIHNLINNKNELFGRCRDDIFFTWNGSKDQVQTFLNEIMINEEQQQHPNIPPLIATIGTTVRLLDLELGHNKGGQLLTKIYRDPKTDEYEVPNKFEYPTCQQQPSSLLKAALQHAVQCCSNEKDFHDECRHLRLSHLFRGFSSDFIDKCINEFYNELGIETKNYFLFPILQYQTLRQRVLNNYEQQIVLKKEHQDRKETIIRIPYPRNWDRQMAVNIENDLLNMFKDNSSNKEAFNDIEFELIPRSPSPLTINDYLVNKRPPLRLLTLPDNDSRS